MRQLVEYLRWGYVRPAPGRIFVAAVGIVVVLIPAASPFGNVRFMALAGVLLALATIVLSFPGLVTTICAFGIIETAVVTVHEGGFVLAIGEAIVLLAYLLVAEIAPVGGELRSRPGELRADLASTFAGGLALLAVVAAFSLLNLSGSFVVAILGVFAAGIIVVALRWMSSDG